MRCGPLSASQVLDFEAVIWGPNKGEIQELFPFPGDSAGAATAINDKAEVVGCSGICGSAAPPSRVHATVWQDGCVKDLGNSNNAGLAINNQGQVVGFSDLPRGYNRSHVSVARAA